MRGCRVLTDGTTAIAVSAIAFLGLTIPVCLVKSPTGDEFFVVWSAAHWELTADAVNNPPLFNALAAAVQSIIPFPWAFVLAPLPLLAAGAVVWRVASREQLPPQYVFAGLLLVQGSLIGAGTYYRSYSLLLAFQALAFAAWNEERGGWFVIFSVLASLTHHLGAFIGMGIVLASRFVKPRLPLYTLLGFVPTLALAATGFGQKHHDVHTWGIHPSDIWLTWWAGMIVTGVFLARGSDLIRRVAVWSVVAHGVVLALLFTIPVREPYLWVTAVPVAILFAVGLRDLAAVLPPPRRLLLTRAVTALIAVETAGLIVAVVVGCVVTHQRRAQVHAALIECYRRGDKILFYPDVDLGTIQEAFSDLNHLQGYPMAVGPYLRRDDIHQEGEVVYEAANGSRLDALPVHVPFAVGATYDALFLAPGYDDSIKVPVGYVQKLRTPEWNVFTRVSPR